MVVSGKESKVSGGVVGTAPQGDPCNSTYCLLVVQSLLLDLHSVWLKAGGWNGACRHKGTPDRWVWHLI